MRLLPVLLVDLALALGAVGLLSLLRPLRWLGVADRRAALVLVLCGGLVGALGVLLPAPTLRALSPSTRLDAAVPEWQFAEFHELRIARLAGARRGGDPRRHGARDPRFRAPHLDPESTSAGEP